MRSVFLPDWRRNPYQTLLADALKRQGVEVQWRDFRPVHFQLNRLDGAAARAEVVHLHWINGLIAPVFWSGGPLRRAVRLAALALDVLLARLRGKRVVWTVHNLVAHESPNPELELIARRVLALACSAIVVHSASALLRVETAYGVRLARKAHVIPHGNYDGCYPEDAALTAALRSQFGLQGSEITLLFFGAVREYKGVLRLIEAFKAARGPQLRLIIAGRTEPEALEQEALAAAAGDDRIFLKLGFVADSEVAPLFALADAVVIPTERALTSGSTVLAMTMRKATLLPEEARVFDLVDETSGIYFNSTAGLTACLENLDKAALARMGVSAGQAADNLKWDSIASTLRAVYAG